MTNSDASSSIFKKLNNRREYLHVSKNGKKAVSNGIVIQVLHNKSQIDNEETSNFIRAGFIITKKIGNAVKRNRVKRRLRALARNILVKNAKSGYDYVFIGRKNTINYRSDMLRSDLISMLKKTNTWKN